MACAARQDTQSRPYNSPTGVVCKNIHRRPPTYRNHKGEHMETWQIVVISIAGFVAVRLLIALLMCGGDFRRLLFVIRAAYRLERDRQFAAKVQAILQPPPPPPPP